MKNEKPLNRMSDGVKKRANDFIGRIKNKLKNSDFKQEIQKTLNTLQVGYKYKDIDIIKESIDKLLLAFDIARDNKLLEGRGIGRTNTARISRLIGGSLDSIQLRPFKNGVALILSVKYVNEKEKLINDKINRKKEIKLSFRLDVALEEDNGKLIPEKVWSGDENGLASNNINKSKNPKDVWGGLI